LPPLHRWVVYVFASLAKPPPEFYTHLWALTPKFRRRNSLDARDESVAYMEKGAPLSTPFSLLTFTSSTSLSDGLHHHHRPNVRRLHRRRDCHRCLARYANRRSSTVVSGFAECLKAYPDTNLQSQKRRTEPALSLPKGVSAPHWRRCARLNSRGAFSHISRGCFGTGSVTALFWLLLVKSRGHVYPLSFLPYCENSNPGPLPRPGSPEFIHGYGSTGISARPIAGAQD
jgi:hypothetical protein